MGLVFILIFFCSLLVLIIISVFFFFLNTVNTNMIVPIIDPNSTWRESLLVSFI